MAWEMGIDAHRCFSCACYPVQAVAGACVWLAVLTEKKEEEGGIKEFFEKEGAERWRCGVEDLEGELPCSVSVLLRVRRGESDGNAQEAERALSEADSRRRWAREEGWAAARVQ